MIFQNTSDTLKISRAGTTFCGKKTWGSEASKWCDPTRQNPEDEQVDPCCKDHNLQPPDQWLGSGGVFWVGGRSMAGKCWGVFGRKVAWSPKACHRYAKLIKIVSVLWLDSLDFTGTGEPIQSWKSTLLICTIYLLFRCNKNASWVLVPECHEKADTRTAASDGFDEFSSRIC